MDKQKLIEAVDAAIAENAGDPVAKVIMSLTKQVWQIDWTVAPFDIVSHYLDFDIPYFYRFMAMDFGDEAEEQALIIEWVNTRHTLNKEAKANLPAICDQLNQIRIEARNA
ncbi:MAG TPA: hypothetical protein V6C58_23715 [Allocoleopsis sp.]